MNEPTQSYAEWNLLYDGEPMQSPVFTGYDDCIQYMKNAPEPHRFTLVFRTVVIQRTAWKQWR